MQNKIYPISAKILLIIIMIGTIGFILGLTIGHTSALNWCVDKGFELLELKGIDIEVNENAIKAAVMIYRKQIDRLDLG